MSNPNQDLFAAECKTISIDSNKMRLHQERIRNVLLLGQRPTFKIIDTCRIDNGGLLAEQWHPPQYKARKQYSEVIGFVPAAGASSRYLEVLQPLQKALLSENVIEVSAEIERLQKHDLTRYALPQALIDILSHQKPLIVAGNIDPMQKAAMLTELNKPKAMLPSTLNGVTYLESKLMEHKAMALGGQVFVVSPSTLEMAAALLENATAPIGKLTYALFIQDMDCSTLRFRPDSEPFREPGGQISPVPGGHGTLTHLFARVKENFPSAESLLIRNVDNVSGVSTAVLSATHHFLEQHHALLLSIKGIRHHLATGDLEGAGALAEKILLTLPISLTIDHSQNQFLKKIATSQALSHLWELQLRLFHFSPELIPAFFKHIPENSLLSWLYHRPVNTFGQVPNTQRDVGGSPVFAQVEGVKVKMCLELPHVRDDDRKNFLENPEVGTHFNPVFVAAEIISDHTAYAEERFPMWILAKKQYKAETVYYHETVLYEVIGNCILANVIFVQVPRIVFKPHKSLADTL